jgi:hypothetical protein
VLRLLGAAVAVAALAALTSDLAGKASSPSTPAPEARATPPPEDEQPRNRKPAIVVHEGDPTVYDSQSALQRCARERRKIGSSSTTAGLDDDVDAISRRVERIRDLTFPRPVQTRLVSRAEVGERFARGFLRRYDAREADRDARVLAALRLVPEGADLRELTSRLLTQGVAGFYNPRKDRLFAGSAGGALTPYDEMVLAHELDHALVDQVLGLPGTLTRDPMLGDVMAGHQALAEGDATLVMLRYARARFTAADYDAFASRFSQRAVQPIPGVPYVFARTSEFPYYEGLLFACRAWRDGGWGAVSDMYLRPPATTADVLFPLRYDEDGEPDLPRPPGSPGGEWGAVHAESFGALDLMVLLENADLLSRGETVPGSHVRAVGGWDGGVLHTWLRGPDTAIHLALVDRGVGTEDGRRRRLCGVLRRWFRETYPDAAPAGRDRWAFEGDRARLRCEGRYVALTMGPSGKVVRNVSRG